MIPTNALVSDLVGLVRYVKLMHTALTQRGFYVACKQLISTQLILISLMVTVCVKPAFSVRSTIDLFDRP